ncbi:unnamed protein product [Gemmataceae bacterium]|nr:unnamed protein product [Gemmataceae bacterium]VTT99288.1 unnamed protein product [Gemmataceae bacterium]
MSWSDVSGRTGGFRPPFAFPGRPVAPGAAHQGRPRIEAPRLRVLGNRGTESGAASRTRPNLFGALRGAIRRGVPLRRAVRWFWEGGRSAFARRTRCGWGFGPCPLPLRERVAALLGRVGGEPQHLRKLAPSPAARRLAAPSPARGEGPGPEPLASSPSPLRERVVALRGRVRGEPAEMLALHPPPARRASRPEAEIPQGERATPEVPPVALQKGRTSTAGCLGCWGSFRLTRGGLVLKSWAWF